MTVLGRMALLLLLSRSLGFCIVSTSPSSLTVSYRQGDSIPSPRNIVIQTSAPFSTHISTNPAGWLGISPSSGSGTTIADVLVDPRTLAVGSYIGIITISDTSTFGNVVNFRVDLTVAAGSATPPVPQITADGHIPHIADGAGWKTEITVVNLSAVGQRITVHFWSDAGTELALPVVNVGTFSGIYFDLSAHGSGKLQTSGTSPLVTTGWASVEGPQPFGATAIFKSSIDGRPDFEAASPSDVGSLHASVVPFDNQNGFATGLALANYGTTAVVVAVNFLDPSGNVVLSTAIPLGVGQHSSFGIADRFPITAGRVGTVQLGSDGVSVLGLRFNPSGAFTSIQVMGR